MLPVDVDAATLTGRLMLDSGPTPIVVRGGEVFDVSRDAPTVSDLMEMAEPAAGDVTDIPALPGRVVALIAEGGPLDVLVNNAADDNRHSIEDVTEEYWDNRFNVNLKHQFFCAQAVIPGMKRNGGGAIINLGSISWHLALPDLVPYQTCKAANEGLTRAMARDLGEHHIRVNCVVPGNVRTPRQLKWYTPEGEAEIVSAQCLKGRLGPDDVAALVLFLASDDAGLMTGHEHFVDAGWR